MQFPQLSWESFSTLRMYFGSKRRRLSGALFRVGQRGDISGGRLGAPFLRFFFVLCFLLCDSVRNEI